MCYIALNILIPSNESIITGFSGIIFGYYGYYLTKSFFEWMDFDFKHKRDVIIILLFVLVLLIISSFTDIICVYPSLMTMALGIAEVFLNSGFLFFEIIGYIIGFAYYGILIWTSVVIYNF